MHLFFRALLRIVSLLLVVAMVVLFEDDLPTAAVDEKYTSPASQFLETETGIRLHFRDEGNPDAEPIVLVHGSNASLHA